MEVFTSRAMVSLAPAVSAIKKPLKEMFER